MPTASPGLTLTVNVDNKQFALSDRIAEGESRTVSIVTSSGDDWPAGSYTLALTYHGTTVALAGCTYNSGALTAALNLATTEIADLFDELQPDQMRQSVDLTLRDASNNILWAIGKCDVWRATYSAGSTSPVVIPSAYHAGSANVTPGASSVTIDISSLSLTAAPAQVLLSVYVPSGEPNVWATGHSETATAITVELSSAPASSGYVIHWLLFPA